MVRSLRIVYLGTPEFSVPALEALIASTHTVCGVITQPDRARGRGQHVSFSPVKAAALAHGIPVFQPERLREAVVLETLRAWAPDLGVVAAYGKIIPEALLQVPPLGMINIHASLLPRLRGAAPIHRAVMLGHVETGVTIMRVVKQLDAGAMFARVTRSIHPDETSETVEKDLAALGASLLVSVIDCLVDGTATEEPQDESQVTYAARLTKEEGLIDWSAPAPTIQNLVRGLYPWPHAYTYLDGHRLILLKTSFRDQSASEAPGTIIGITPEGFEVATGRGRILVLQVQPEGRRPMPARDFLSGHRVSVGQQFTGASSPPAPDTPAP